MYKRQVLATDISSQAECSIQRHTERETFAGLLDEYRVGISLIFYMENSLEYRIRRQAQLPSAAKKVALSGLSIQGKILLPVQKTKQQSEDLKQAARKRSSLLEDAKRGDEDAIETLTVEDIDLYTMVSRRIAHEDCLLYTSRRDTMKAWRKVQPTRAVRGRKLLLLTMPSICPAALRRSLSGGI